MRRRGFEPLTREFSVRCSTRLSYLRQNSLANKLAHNLNKTSFDLDLFFQPPRIQIEFIRELHTKRSTLSATICQAVPDKSTRTVLPIRATSKIFIGIQGEVDLQTKKAVDLGNKNYEQNLCKQIWCFC